MTTTPPSRAPSESWPGGVTIATLVTACIVAAAPAAGMMRSRLSAVLGAWFVPLLTAGLAVATVTALAAGLRTRRRLQRRQVAIIAGAVTVAGTWVWLTGSSDAAIRVVELVHFVEYGVITFVFHRAFRQHGTAALPMAALAAFLAGTIEEGYQWWLPARVGEVQDVLLNGVAIACALAVTAALAPPSPASWPARATARLGRLAALVVIALALFVQVVHLGDDVVIGPARFGSRFTAAQLDDAARERWRAWGAAPPLVRPARLSREDQYASEGLQHVQTRNTATAAGEAVTAWHENRILERFFAPVLDTPSYVSASGHRWSEAQRAAIEDAVGDRGEQPFDSRAFPYPLYRWPPLWLWSGALALAAALLVFTGRTLRA